MRFPQHMAREGVRAPATALRGGDRPSGLLNTGIELVTGDPAAGVKSRDVVFGVRNCRGDRPRRNA
jgi:fructose transport system substrate-binding protein